MCNCGKGPSSLPANTTTAGPVKATARPAMPTRPLLFEYTGNTGLTVFGPVTRTRYRFPHPGARARVDARDAASFSSVPHVRRIATE